MWFPYFEHFLIVGTGPDAGEMVQILGQPDDSTIEGKLNFVYFDHHGKFYRESDQFEKDFDLDQNNLRRAKGIAEFISNQWVRGETIQALLDCGACSKIFSDPRENQEDSKSFIDRMGFVVNIVAMSIPDEFGNWVYEAAPINDAPPRRYTNTGRYINSDYPESIPSMRDLVYEMRTNTENMTLRLLRSHLEDLLRHATDEKPLLMTVPVNVPDKDLEGVLNTTLREYLDKGLAHFSYGGLYGGQSDQPETPTQE